MGLSLKQIRNIAHRLPELSGEMQRNVSRQFADFILQELQRQHHTGRSIYGDRYPRPKKGNQPMLDTGELSQAYEVRVIDGGRSISVTNGSEHTIVNCDKKHPHLPDERGLPPRWTARLEQIKRAEARRFMTAVRALSKA